MTQIFLSYTRADREGVEDIYGRLSVAGFSPWMDTKNIRAGENWALSITRAIQSSAFFLACLTKRYNRRDTLLEEMNTALKVMERLPEEYVYLIPVRLEPCPVPRILNNFHWVDLFSPDGWELLVGSLREELRRRNQVWEPVQGSAQLPAAFPLRRVRPSTAGGSSLGGADKAGASHVLVVEDDARITFFLVPELRRMGFQVSVAKDGHEGLESAKKLRPDLVILDVMMPKLNGYEVCRALKSDAETRHIPVVMLSAKGQQQDKNAAREAGANDYLTKPYDKIQLEERLKQFIVS